MDQELAIGVKWWSTGRKWVQTLSSKPNFAVDIRSFLSGGDDPDDAIDHLDRLASAIATTGKNEMTSDDTTESWHRRDGAQAMAGELVTVDNEYPWAEIFGRIPPQSEGMYSFGEEEISEQALEIMAETIVQEPSIVEACSASKKGGGKGYVSKGHMRNLLHTAFVHRGKGGGGKKGGGKGKSHYSKGGRGYIWRSLWTIILTPFQGW